MCKCVCVNSDKLCLHSSLSYNLGDESQGKRVEEDVHKVVLKGHFTAINVDINHSNFNSGLCRSITLPPLKCHSL